MGRNFDLSPFVFTNWPFVCAAGNPIAAKESPILGKCETNPFLETGATTTVTTTTIGGVSGAASNARKSLQMLGTGGNMELPGMSAKGMSPKDDPDDSGAGGVFTEAENIRSPMSFGSTRTHLLPWSQHNRSFLTTPNVLAALENTANSPNPETSARPGEIVMRYLFADFTQQAEKKIEAVMCETADKNLSKLLQRGEDLQFDQLLSTLGSVAEHCLPSLLTTLIAWRQRQISHMELKIDSQPQAPQKVATKDTDIQFTSLQMRLQRRESAVEFIFCLALIEVLKQLPFHPGHEDLIRNIENLAFKHFKYREGLQNNPNAHNIHIIADLYAEVIGVLAQSRFSSVKKRFMAELKELRAKEPNSTTTQSIISLLMGMKFFRVKVSVVDSIFVSLIISQPSSPAF